MKPVHAAGLVSTVYCRRVVELRHQRGWMILPTCYVETVPCDSGSLEGGQNCDELSSELDQFLGPGLQAVSPAGAGWAFRNWIARTIARQPCSVVTQGTPLVTAAARIFPSSVRAPCRWGC